jgi:hypothetical protein
MPQGCANCGPTRSSNICSSAISCAAAGSMARMETKRATLNSAALIRSLMVATPYSLFSAETTARIGAIVIEVSMPTP